MFTYDEQDETAARAKANDLGLAPPIFSMASAPAVMEGWIDRVWQCWIASRRGQLTDEMLDDCDRQAGVPASRVRAAVLAPDPMGGISEAIRAYCGEAP